MKYRDLLGLLIETLVALNGNGEINIDRLKDMLSALEDGNKDDLAGLIINVKLATDLDIANKLIEELEEQL